MRKRIVYKYPLVPPTDVNMPIVVMMPKGAVVLDIAVQGELDVMLWASVDPDAELEERRFFAIPTGDPFDAEGLHFEKTVHMPKAKLVFHFYEAF